VDIHGEVTGFAESVLTEAYNQACGASVRAIVFNFSGLQYMNSSGIGLLVTLLIRAQRQKLRLLACGLNEHYRQIFELTRLNEAIGIYSSEGEALAAVS
jgi:anti-sigma B factor antagonist